MRPRKLKWLWAGSRSSAMRLKRDELLMKLGAARSKARAAWRLVDIEVDPQIASFSHTLNRDSYAKCAAKVLLAPHQSVRIPAGEAVEVPHPNLKGDREVRPIFHQTIARIEARIFATFMACCLHVTLHARRSPLAGGLTPRRCSTSLLPSRLSMFASPPPKCEPDPQPLHGAGDVAGLFLVPDLQMTLVRTSEFLFCSTRSTSVSPSSWN